jgi:RHS repeat-associated protein
MQNQMAQAKVESYNNYYPFGMLMPGRNASSEGYRYGFNGKEMDNGMKGGGTGAVYDYGFRIYDARIGKFLSVDPLTEKYPELTPYQFASNTPIESLDIDGLEKLPFCVHMAMNSYSPGIGLVSYMKDWLTDGPLTMLEGFEHLGQNERTYKEDNILTQNMDKQTQIINYTMGKVSGTTTVIAGLAKTYEPYFDEMTIISTFGYGGAPLEGLGLGFTKQKIGINLMSGFGRESTNIIMQTGNMLKKSGSYLFRLEFSPTTLSSGIADFTSQMTMNRGDIYQWNFIGTLSSAFFKLPFIQSTIGSGLDMRLDDFRSGSFGQNTIIGKKTLFTFGQQSIIGGTFNYLGSESIQGDLFEKKYYSPFFETPRLYVPYTVSNVITTNIDNKVNE